MDQLVYITIDQAVEIHRKTVEVSGGGELGALDLGRLESVLEHIQNDLYYPAFEDKLTHLFFSANKFHCFQDGNKRIAISLGAQFLLLNGYVFVATRFMREMENVSYHVANGNIDKELLREIIGAVIEDRMDDEELKLKIVHAISEKQITSILEGKRVIAPPQEILEVQNAIKAYNQTQKYFLREKGKEML